MWTGSLTALSCPALGTAVGPVLLKTCDTPLGSAAAMSDFSLNNELASPEALSPCAAARLPSTPSTSGVASDISLPADEELTPPDLATASVTEDARFPKMVPRSCWPEPKLLLVRLPPLNRE